MSKKNTTSASQSKSISQRLKEYNKNLYDFLSKEVINWYYLEHKCLTMNQMIKFKTVSKDIDNILTLMVAYRFVEKLQRITLNKTKPFAQITPKDIDARPNANGYDIVYKKDDLILVAEVKCILPCENNNTTYGAEQKEGIIKDLKGLVYKTSKSKSDNQITNDQFNSAYKFLVLIEGNELAMQQVLGDINKYDPLDSTKRMKQELRELAVFLKGEKNINNMRIVNFEDSKTLSPSVVNVMYIQPDDNLISDLLDEKNNGCNISAQL